MGSERSWDLASLEAAMGVSFRDKNLVRQAMAHSSYLNENPGAFADSNERLEFLGDAVIGVAVADELYRRYPKWAEGELTQARSAVVRGETLAGVAKGLQLGRHLSMGKGEEAGGGPERPSNLAAALEALVGALFLDQGFGAARGFAIRVLSRELSNLGRRAGLKSPKATLQEAVQKDGMPPPSYRIVGVAGSDHVRRFTAEVAVGGEVLGQGTGPRKSQAEEEAASEALRGLSEHPRLQEG